MLAEDFYTHIPDPVQPAPAWKKVHSHYENLKVSRTASEDEIRKSYRRLISKHHSDRNKSPNADVVAQRIIKAYKLLTKSCSRAEHDAWIVEEERKLNLPRPVYTAQATPPQPKQTQYAQDPINWNPEHVVEFRIFVQKWRVKFGESFNEMTTDWLYQCFLDDLNTQQAVAKAQEDVRKAKILSLCCGLAILLATAYIGVLILK